MTNLPSDSLGLSASVESRRTSCPICDGPDVVAVYRFPGFAVLKCRACGGAWRSNMYSAGDITAMYTSEEYARNPYFSYDLARFKTAARRRHDHYLRALASVEAKIGVATLLDVGCGSGAFLHAAKERGWSVSGVELSPVLARACRQATGVEVVNASFETAPLPANAYDLVSMWDMIEHVLDPVACVRRVGQLLKPGGVALFCTPDEDSLLARTGQLLYRLSGGRMSYPAQALHPTYHTFFFSRHSFLGMLRRSGLHIVTCRSQEAFFEHSELPGALAKWGIRAIEQLGALADRRYELVCLAQKPR